MLQQEQLLKVDRPCPDPDPKVAAESTPPPPSTYQMRPTLEQTFKSEKIKQIINTVLTDTLSGQTYTAVDAARWTKTLADEISLKVKDLEMKRYKHVVQVVLGQQLGAGFMKISGRSVGEGHPVFIVAEVGQNHQGSVEIAKQMILHAKEIGVDCVKFQKSNLSSKFTRNALQRSYTGNNSWGRTYGEHKAHLEFSIEEYRILQKFCSEVGILFSASAMDPTSLEQLKQLELPFIKIGSGDADNIPLLREAAASDVPFIVSTGMQCWKQVARIHQMFQGKPVALLHCVSAYPTPPAEALLRLIPLYRQQFPEFVIGYSGHELGLQITLASVLLGACVVERHFTLNKTWKGTDHKASLDPTEFGKLVQYIRTVDDFPIDTDKSDIPSILSEIMDESDLNHDELLLALTNVTVNDRKLLPSEVPCHSKLGKSLVFNNDVKEQHVLEIADVAVKVSEPPGLSPTCFDQMVGRKVALRCYKDEPILGTSLIN